MSHLQQAPNRQATALFDFWRRPLLAVTLLCLLPLSTLEASPLQGTANLDLTRGTVNTESYPWSTLGRLNIGGRAFCTGVMIGKNHLYTQAHCLYNKAEKRWWKEEELHFRAGYQRDNHIGSSDIARIEISESYDPANPNSLASMTGDWALVTLKEPLGQRTGWLGLKNMDQGLRQRLRSGTANIFNAGYHSGWGHAVKLSSNCSKEATQKIPGIGSIPCRESRENQRSLPTIMYQNGTYKLISSAAFNRNDSPNRKDSHAFASLKTANNEWGHSQRPNL
ncbi:trypsin-like serine protease [Kiloniella laminariae]|uniref:Trypsin-like serine protease n=1 Tax=Kiloniella laminariae TaxID=454162 RepID=A0ABT4LHU5_9PROT|nr:trypsin-like serine protease [Kiloniella laminariae]MCZ4280670.1 trypsin-like serine protease [Kiloniella laminariae]